MGEAREDRSGENASPNWRTRLALLPLRLRLFALLLFLLALAPALVELAGFAGGPGAPPLSVFAGRPALAAALSLAAAVLAVCVLERPRNRSPRAYARQVAARLRQIQSDFDGALRRRAHEEEENPNGKPIQLPDP